MEKTAICSRNPRIKPIKQLLAELKWLPELDTDKRMEGDYIWFKFGFLF